MSRKVYVDMVVRVIIDMDEGVNVDDTISELIIDITTPDFIDNAMVFDHSVETWNVIDSKIKES